MRRGRMWRWRNSLCRTNGWRWSNSMPVGVRIVDDPTPSGDGMPVMDVPVFVGFAARGPLNRPVAIDSVAGFEAVFGGLLDLVQGGQGEDPGERLTAHLFPAVAAFFSSGGRRCHI